MSTTYLDAAKVQLEKAGTNMANGQQQTLMIAAAQATALIDIAESLRAIKSAVNEFVMYWVNK